MMLKYVVVVLLVLLQNVCNVAAAQSAPAQATQNSTPPPSQLDARSWVLYDMQSNQLITGYKHDEAFDPASLTKLMSAYLVYDALKQKKLKPDQVVPVSDKARHAIGSRMFIQQNMPVTVEDLIRGMIVQSGNDATIALAEAVAGSEDAFAEMMNREAQRMGLLHTHFVNSTGLPAANHVATARDLATLTAALIRDFPEYYPLYGQKEYRYNQITQPNRNRLLWRDSTVDGVKTGHTDAAGYCLVGSAKRGERRLVSVVMGAKSDAARASESQKLLNYGYLYFDTVKVYDPRQAAHTSRVWKGTRDSVGAGVVAGLYITVPKGQAGNIKARVESEQPLIAPVHAGQVIARLKLELNGKPYSEVPLVALEEVPEASIFGRAWDSVRLLLH